MANVPQGALRKDSDCHSTRAKQARFAFRPGPDVVEGRSDVLRYCCAAEDLQLPLKCMKIFFLQKNHAARRLRRLMAIPFSRPRCESSAPDRRACEGPQCSRPRNCPAGFAGGVPGPTLPQPPGRPPAGGGREAAPRRCAERGVGATARTISRCVAPRQTRDSRQARKTLPLQRCEDNEPQWATSPNRAIRDYPGLA